MSRLRFVAAILAAGALKGGFLPSFAHADDPPKPITPDPTLLVVPPPGPASAAEFLARGKQYIDQKVFHLAVQDLDDAVRLAPTSVEARLVRAQANFELKEFNKTIADTTEAIRLDPNHAPAFRNRAVARINRGQLDDALADLNVAVRLDPGDPSAFNDRALVWYQKREFAKTIADLDEVVRLGKPEPMHFINRGSAKLELGQLAAAVADLDEAIRRQPDSAFARSQRAAALCRLDRPADALADADRAVALDPGFPGGWFNRGFARARLGRTDGAIADYTEAIRLNATDLATVLALRLERAKVYEAKRDFAAALEDYEAAARGAGPHLAAVAKLVWFLATCPDASYRDGKRAVELGRPLAAIAPYTLSFLALAAAYAEVGDFAEAVRWQTKALHDPGRAVVRRGGTEVTLTYDPGKDGRAKMEEALKEYEAKRPHREELAGK
jgi:tetratricopeptide (TPR) repeat protein